MLFRCVLIVVIALGGYARPVFAQTQGPSSYQVKVQELVSITNMAEIVVTQADAMTKLLTPVMTKKLTSSKAQGGAGLPESKAREIINAFSDILKRKLRASIPQFVEALVPIYQKYYTEQDLDQIIAFYKTPAGHKVVVTMPRLLQETTQLTIPFTKQVVDASMAEFQSWVQQQAQGKAL